MLAGEAIRDLVAELGITNATLYEWRRQALIDAGRRPGAKSSRLIHSSKSVGASKSSRPSSRR
jgi:transposase-like protein